MNPFPDDGPDPVALLQQTAESFTKFWSDVGSRMTSTAIPGTIPSPESVREVRSRFLKALGTAYDEYLHSPQFTAMLREMLSHGVQMRRQMTEAVGRTYSECQGVSRQDIDTLMEGMQHIEKRMADSFERIEDRLKRLESHLASPAPDPPPPIPDQQPVAKPKSRGKKKHRAK